MKDFIKGIIPNTFYLLAASVYLLSKIIGVFSSLLAACSVSLHMAFNTEKGKKYKAYETKLREANEMIAQFQQQLMAQQSKKQFDNDANRLVNSLKTNQQVQELPKNVIQLEKKKDDPTDSNS